MNNICVITLTGTRPVALELCYKYFERQTLLEKKGYNVTWIIVDDGGIPTAFPNLYLQKQNVNQIILNPKPSWDEKSGNTFVRNFKTALEAVPLDSEICIVYEDDDWYSSDYFEWVVSNHTTDNMILGESHSYYYNLRWQKSNSRTYPNYAAFAQTSFSSGLIPYLQWTLDNHKDSYDMHFWKKAPEETFLSLCPNIHNMHVIGMKSLPGRSGIGRGHTKNSGGIWLPDTKTFSTLRSYVGNEDALAYINIINDYKRK